MHFLKNVRVSKNFFLFFASKIIHFLCILFEKFIFNTHKVFLYIKKILILLEKTMNKNESEYENKKQRIQI